ncbi:MAG: hypothetical protein ACRYHQ_19935, partial [Janthinobacterium lividum]
MKNAWIVLPAILCALAATPAPARPGPVAPSHETHRATHPASAAPSTGTWSAPCGREPVAPVVDTSTVDRFNAAVDHVTLYEKAARSYSACISKAATVQQTAVSNDAKTRIDAIQAVSSGVQKRIAA